MNLADILHGRSKNPYSQQISSHVVTISPDKRDKIEQYKENIESKVIDHTYRLENVNEQIKDTPLWNPHRIILEMQTRNYKKNLINLVAKYTILQELSSQYDEVTERAEREKSEQQIIPAMFVDQLVGLHHNYKRMGGTKTYHQFDDLVSRLLKKLD